MGDAGPNVEGRHTETRTRAKRTGGEERRVRTRLVVPDPGPASGTIYRDMLEQANQAVLVAQDGLLRYVNRKVCEIIGRSRDELLGCSFSDFLHPEDRSRVLERHRRRMQGGDFLRVYPCRIIDRHGGVRWFEVNSVLFQWEGRPATLVTLPEITQRVATEAALRSSEDQYRQLVQSANSIILRRNVRGTITFLNAHGLEFFGYRDEEILGRNAIGTILPERDAHGNDLAAMGTELDAHPARYLTQETESLRRNGERVWIAWTNKGIVNRNGRLVEILSIGNDITEQRRLEEQLLHSQKMEAFGQLAAGISHDFNNLLTAIAGYSEMMLMDLSEEDPLHHKAQQIKLAGERAATLTQQLLAVGRKQMLRPRSLQLNEEVSRMNGMLRRLIGEDIELVEELGPALPPVVVDPSRIGQVILNLVVNARDAMPAGGRLLLKTSAVMLDGDAARRIGDLKAGPYVELEVRDNGIGMGEDTCKRVFEPFFSTKEPGRGSGLGLSTVYGIVKQSGGAVRIESILGEGTALHIYLPSSCEAEKAPARSVLSVVPASEQETVLLVEDEAMVRRLLQEVLRKSGFRVLTAAGGADALRVAERHRGRIHLVVTDVVMPRMSGCELVARLAKARPDMKVLYMSGYAKDATVHHLPLSQDTDWIEKPFSASYLVSRVQDMLRRM